ncbi:MAG TPA: HAMP domain-containing sensor histidine kinase [Saprospiraceae bacterium]|nr:HAMP domain-containing sensor histidine kinase [Saprospiraceae bacterium]HPI05325.1 HAMP domain-containing sensor histidine kinase [Saprospiraceae bacterium]
MIKRLLLYIVAMIILLALALSAGQWDKDTTLLQQHAEEISDWLAAQEAEGLAWGRAHVGQPDVWKDQSEKSYTVLLHHQDSILSWSNTHAIPAGPMLKKIAGAPGVSVQKLPLGWFLCNSETKAGNALTVLVPIRYALDFNTLDRGSVFPAGKNIDDHIQVVNTATDYPIEISGKALAWLDASNAVESGWLQWVQLIAYLFFFILFFSLLNRAAMWLNRKAGPLAGTGLLLAGTAILLWLNIATGFTQQQFSALPLFTPAFENASFIGQSVGDWLIHSCLLVYIMVFFHRRFGMVEKTEPVDDFSEEIIPGTETADKKSGMKSVVAAFCYLLVMLSIPFSVQVMRELVLHSRLGFDFDNILNLGTLGVLALTGLIILMVGLFLFSHRMLLTIEQLNLPLKQRAVALGGAAVLITVLAIPMGMDPLFVAVFALLYAALFDAFVHWKAAGFGWLIAWLLVFSCFASAQLYRYSALKDKDLRFEYATALAADRDTIVENALPTVLTTLQKDSQQTGLLLKPWPFKATAISLAAHLNEQIFDRTYLFQHYRLRAFAFDRENQPLLLDQSLGYEQVMSKWNAFASSSFPNPNIHDGVDEEGKTRYMLLLHVNRMGDPAQPTRIFVFLDHAYPAPTKVYAQIFYRTPYKNLARLPRYDFAVEKNGRLLVEQGLTNTWILNTELDKGASTQIESGGRIDAIAKSADGSTVATVGRSDGGWIKQIYLFSILFTLASIFMMLLALANSAFGFLPEAFDFRLSTRGSLARRIHLWYVTLLAAAFLVTGYLTYRHFTQAARDNERSDLDYRAETLLNGLKSQVLNARVSDDSLRRTLPQTLRAMSASMGMDANLYDANGNLLFTTQEDLAALGIIPSRMNAEAWNALKVGWLPEQVENEQVAGMKYYSKYLALYSNLHTVLGYLGVPYQLSNRKAGAEVSDFLGMLASLYVFLLLIAYAVTFGLARSIVRPISLLSEKVRAVQLTDKNLPLEYAGDEQDEISELIGQYNRMVDKLETSKVQLVRLEREGAWREMARQVAHDIKNPLTTMKLSMQQLERVSNNPEQAAAYLRKAITRLIEQIDSLAQIASEFSMFANLDIQVKHDVVINEVVESVHDLFSEQKNVDLSLSLPDQRFHILGDKNHLIRVFNNLVINAIQAIPSDRRGHIHVSLKRQDKMAVIQISDNGGGIPEEIGDRVFEPNFTTKTSGSGLGLAICKKIIEAHDGDIRFETRENEGTDFFVEMPVMAVE